MSESSSFERPASPPTFAQVVRKHRTVERRFEQARRKRDTYIRLMAETLVFEEKIAGLSRPLLHWELSLALDRGILDARATIAAKNFARKR